MIVPDTRSLALAAWVLCGITWSTPPAQAQADSTATEIDLTTVASASGFADPGVVRGPRLGLGDPTSGLSVVAAAQPGISLDEIGGGGALLYTGDRYGVELVGSYAPRAYTRYVSFGPTAAAPFEERTEITTRAQAALVSWRSFSPTTRVAALVGFHVTDVSIEGTLLDANGDDLEGDATDEDQRAVARLRVGAAYDAGSTRLGVAQRNEGGRVRLEASLYAGSTSFFQINLQAIRYVNLAPVTLAFRAGLLSNMGANLDDPAAVENLGDPLTQVLVRGYQGRAFDLDACSFVERGPCPEQRRLQGTHVAVGSIEARFPIAGMSERAYLASNHLPTEVALFADLGAAWAPDEELDVRFDADTTDRVPVASVGAALRLWVFGRLPLELYAARPFHHADASWTFGFDIGLPVW